MRRALDFLSALACNNNKEWFDLHRDEYQAARQAYLNLAQQWIDGLVAMDPSLKGNTLQNTVWRINRDIRFSMDKRPYKEWMGCFVAAGAPGQPKTIGKKSMRGGYYLHLEPGTCMICGGIWDPGKELLKALRQEIEANYEEVEQIFATPGWQRYYGDFDTEYMLKKVPAGFDPDFVHADWLKRKAYTFSSRVSDEDICRPDVIEDLLERARAAKPMNDFLNYTFDEYGEFPSHCR